MDVEKTIEFLIERFPAFGAARQGKFQRVVQSFAFGNFP